MSRKLLSITILAVLICIFPLTAYANSSWYWITETTPLTVLPFAVVFTLVVEIFTVIKFGQVKRPVKAALIVSGANIVSFMVPLLYFWFSSLYFSFGYSMKEIFLSAPFYIIGSGFLLLTLAAELPIVFFTLRHEAVSSNRLLLSIVISNIITTAAVAVAERLFCAGTY